MRAVRSPLPPGYGECTTCDSLTPLADLALVCPDCKVQRVVAMPVARPVEIFYAAPEAARILGVTPGTVRAWIAAGALPARQLGTPKGPNGARYRIARSALGAFLRQRQAAG